MENNHQYRCTYTNNAYVPDTPRHLFPRTKHTYTFCVPIISINVLSYYIRIK